MKIAATLGIRGRADQAGTSHCVPIDGRFLDYLAGLVEPVKLHYLWRPQLGDIADEMVLETAINGRADCIVTFNTRHFAPAMHFGIETIRPDEALRRIR